MFDRKALVPKATLLFPTELTCNGLKPIATLALPIVFDSKALRPKAMLLAIFELPKPSVNKFTVAADKALTTARLSIVPFTTLPVPSWISPPSIWSTL